MIATRPNLQIYNHIPSMHAILTGVSFGIARISGYCLMASRTIGKELVLTSVSYLKISFIVLRCILVPFFEEAIFRANLDKPTAKQVMKNSVLFGLMHAFLPGSLQARIIRALFSTVGGFFYCGARVQGKDVWSPAIAHSIYNLTLSLIL